MHSFRAQASPQILLLASGRTTRRAAGQPAPFDKLKSALPASMNSLGPSVAFGPDEV